MITLIQIIIVLFILGLIVLTLCGIYNGMAIVGKSLGKSLVDLLPEQKTEPYHEVTDKVKLAEERAMNELRLKDPDYWKKLKEQKRDY